MEDVGNYGFLPGADLAESLADDVLAADCDVTLLHLAAIFEFPDRMFHRIQQKAERTFVPAGIQERKTLP